MMAFVTNSGGFSSKGHFRRIKIKSIKISLKKERKKKKGDRKKKTRAIFICSIQEIRKKKAPFGQHSAKKKKKH
jgi:hypothetical protein